MNLMKQIYISDLAVDQEFQDFFLVKSFSVRTGSNKREFLDLLLADNTGEIPAKKWEVLEPDRSIKTGDIIKVKASVTEWNGQKQLRIIRLRMLNPDEEISPDVFYETAPEKPEEMFLYLMDRVSEMKDEDFKKIALAVLEENKEDLLYYPAAVKNHHSIIGGLLYHMKRMAMSAEYCCKVYQNLNRDLLITGVVIHDIEKITELEAERNGLAKGYSFEGQMLGHITQGVKYISRLSEELEIDSEKAIMLEHMILSHHYEPEFGSPRKPMFPEAEVLHYLDIVDARIYDMEYALASTEPGEFSEKVFTLENRRVYKPFFSEE